MKIEVCEKCENFIQHYTYSKFGLTKINCGHCHKRQMNKKECSLFKETEQTFEDEISIFAEIVKYKIIFNSVIYKINTLGSVLDNIEKQVQSLIKEKKHN